MADGDVGDQRAGARMAKRSASADVITLKQESQIVRTQWIETLFGRADVVGSRRRTHGQAIAIVEPVAPSLGKLYRDPADGGIAAAEGPTDAAALEGAPQLRRIQ